MFCLGGREKRELTDKDLADGSACCKAEHIFPHCWIAAHEIQRGAELACTSCDIHADPLAQSRGNKIRTTNEIQARDEGAHHVVGAHHLRARIWLERLKDKVLCAVGQAVKQQVNAQQQHAPRHICIVAQLGAFLLLLLARVQRKDGHASRHGGDDEVLVQRVALAKDGDVQEHDGE